MVFLQYQEIAKKLTKYQFAQKLKNGSACRDRPYEYVHMITISDLLHHHQFQFISSNLQKLHSVSLSSQNQQKAA